MVCYIWIIIHWYKTGSYVIFVWCLYNDIFVVAKSPYFNSDIWCWIQTWHSEQLIIVTPGDKVIFHHNNELVSIHYQTIEQNGRHYADSIFNCIFLNENVHILVKFYQILFFMVNYYKQL